MSEWITPTKGSKCMESRVMEMHLCKHIEHILAKVLKFKSDLN